MRKTELYRSIDSIQQDKDLKERIVQAAEERDEIVVLKRPVFVPVMIAMLLFLNAGMMAKLVIFNKSQVNMSELKAKTSIESTTDTSEEQHRLEELEKAMQEEQKRKIMEELQKKEQLTKEEQAKAVEEEALKYEMNLRFEEAKEKFITDMQNNDFNLIFEWLADENYKPDESMPYYFNEMGGSNGAYTYRRYVEIIKFDESNYPENHNIDVFAQEYNEETKTAAFNCAFTNHEYIIGYDGQGYDYDNIVSITESNVSSREYDKDKLIEATEIDAGIYKKAIQITDEYIKENFPDDITIGIDADNSIYPHGLYCMFPSESNDSGIDIFYKYYSCFEIEDKNIKGNYTFYEVPLLITPECKDVNEKMSDIENYWKETVYSSYAEFPSVVKVPNVTGMSVSEAEDALEEVGLTIHSRTYSYATDPDIEQNHVISVSPSAGTDILEGSSVELIICGKMVPPVYGLPLEEAVNELEKYGIKSEIEYIEGVEPDDNGLYVDYTSPSVGNGIIISDTITLYVAADDTYITSSLLGCAVNLDENNYDYRKIYTAEETKELLKDAEVTAEVTKEAGGLYLSAYGYNEYSNTTFYGKYYGKIFYINSFETFSEIGNSIPHLKCGMDESVLDEVIENEFYKEKSAKIVKLESYEYYDYAIKYSYNDESSVIAYILIEDGKITKIYAEHFVEQLN